MKKYIVQNGDIVKQEVSENDLKVMQDVLDYTKKKPLVFEIQQYNNTYSDNDLYSKSIDDLYSLRNYYKSNYAVKKQNKMLKDIQEGIDRKSGNYHCIIQYQKSSNQNNNKNNLLKSFLNHKYFSLFVFCTAGFVWVYFLICVISVLF